MAFDQIDAVANVLRTSFLQRKNKYFKSKYNLPGQYNLHAFWLKVAERCIAANADPDDFVEASFQYSTMSSGPYPNMMNSDAAVSAYKKHTAGRNDIIKARAASTDAGRDHLFDPNTSVHVLNMRADIAYVTNSLIRLTGTAEVNDVTIEYINSYTTSYPPYVRVLLGFRNPKVKLFFGEEANRFYLNHPGMVTAAETLGYPIRDILLWLNAPPN